MNAQSEQAITGVILGGHMGEEDDEVMGVISELSLVTQIE